MSESALRSLIGEFGKAVGLDELAFDDQQRCNLMFDDVPVSFELGSGEDSLYIYSVLGAEAEEGAEALYSDLLKANYAFAQTGGATLALDPAGGGIVLMREEPLETLRLPRLESLVENFVNVAERLMANLAEGSLSNAGGAADSVASSEPAEAGGATLSTGTMRV